LRDDEVDLLELPSCHSKRALYNRFLQESGWDYTFDAMSRVKKKQRIEGSEQKQPVSWPTFLSFRRKNYSNIVIVNPSKDICGECYTFAIRQRLKARNVTNPVVSPDCSDGEQSVNEANHAAHDVVDDNNPLIPAQALADKPRILAAAEHVKMAQKQRELYQFYKGEARRT